MKQTLYTSNSAQQSDEGKWIIMNSTCFSGVLLTGTYLKTQTWTLNKSLNSTPLTWAARIRFPKVLSKVEGVTRENKIMSQIRTQASFTPPLTPSLKERNVYAQSTQTLTVTECHQSCNMGKLLNNPTTLTQQLIARVSCTWEPIVSSMFYAEPRKTLVMHRQRQWRAQSHLLANTRLLHSAYSGQTSVIYSSWWDQSFGTWSKTSPKCRVCNSLQWMCWVTVAVVTFPFLTGDLQKTDIRGIATDTMGS